MGHAHPAWVDVTACGLGAFAGGLIGFYLAFMTATRVPRLGRLLSRLAPR